MQFSSPRPRRRSEPALPMINVVFLLLIFFLMSAQIVAPPPFELTPPSTERWQSTQTDLRLHISAEAELALGETRAEAVWATLATVEAPAKTRLLIRADATLPAQELAAVVARLSALGFSTLQLATVPQ